MLCAAIRGIAARRRLRIALTRNFWHERILKTAKNRDAIE